MRFLHVHIVIVLCMIATLSSLYFICLVLSLPLYVFIITVAVCTGGIIYYLQKGLNTPITRERKMPLFAACVIGGACLFFAVIHSLYRVPYGYWDAFSIWNYHAKLIADPVHWQQLYHSQTIDHPDYPLCIPATIAPFWRGMKNNAWQVPFALCLWTAIAVPLFLLAGFWDKSKPIAIALLAYFLVSKSYLIQSNGQYADTLLSLFLVASVACIEAGARGQNMRWYFCAGCFIAALGWTKNEGILLSLFMLCFTVKDLFRSGKKAGWLLLGALLPFTALVICKFGFAPVNYMIAKQKGHTLSRLTDLSRLMDIVRFFGKLFWSQFKPLLIVLVLFAAWCVRNKTWPGRTVVLALGLAFAYVLVYMITPLELHWQLETSGERLVHQLIPLLLFGIAGRLVVKRRAVLT